MKWKSFSTAPKDGQWFLERHVLGDKHSDGEFAIVRHNDEHPKFGTYRGYIYRTQAFSTWTEILIYDYKGE